MSLDQGISLLVSVTLIEISFATGLGVRLADVTGAAKDGPQLLGAGLANYVAVPAAAVTLILVVNGDPLVAAGILILAVCPGAPYGPPLTALAWGTTATSVGLMVILAGSSVVLAPLLLSLLLPLTTGGADLQVDPLEMLAAIVTTQLLPLCCGLAISQRRPALAARWLGPAFSISKILNAATLALILTSQFSQLREVVRPGGILAMLTLLGVSLGAGWIAGGQRSGDRKAVALTTAIRNVGLGLMITTSTFPGTPAATAVLVYGLVQLLGSFLLALWWRRSPSMIEARSDGRARTQ
ncbi:bile acid:sodium symporter [Microvirga sp. HBU67558]|uniref:bile acid:sodium symporter family protein n=1 Tax=Microvirga TaxID=186650 RepID=UPI001B39AF21|nr:MULTISPECIES: bile acid:sodium symporter [unclassified Microvirga]MBQ0822909.1 bile acid:sodium symporter [Microvirga sp. HBU67558]